jgi:iron complex outermembrane receptor protein
MKQLLAYPALVTTVLLTLLPCPARAQEEEMALPRTSSATEQALKEELLFLREERVSIASRYEQPISEAPSNVYVITEEDIRRSGATDIPTLLRRVPGFEVMQTNATDFNVSVRGNNQLTANTLLVLIDGRSVYIDQAGVVFWKMLPVALPAIKRIEVLKGPASALYGFNAFDGVVNIITKSPEEIKGTTLQAAGGELGTILTTAVHAGHADNWGYRLSAGHEQNQSWANRDLQALNTQKVTGLADYHLASGGRVRGEAGFLTANPYNGSVHAIGTTINTPFHHAYGALGYDSEHLQLHGWYNSYDAEGPTRIFAPLSPLLSLTDRTGNPDQRYSLDTYNVDGYYHTPLSHTVTLGIGANYRRILEASNILAQRTHEDRLGLFSQTTWKPTTFFEIVGGLRYDLDTFVTPTLSPRVAVLFRPQPEHTLRFSWSVAYRPPIMSEVAIDARNVITLPGFQQTSFVLGSNDVRPEQIHSYELGYQGWWWQHRLRTRASLFFNHINDLIEFRNASGIPTDPSRPVNGGVADIYGGEAGIEWLATSWLSGFVNYSYQEAGQSLQGFSRRGFPRHKVNAGLRLTWTPALSGDLTYHHVGAATYPLADAFTLLRDFVTVPTDRVRSYNLLNLRLAYRFWQEQVEDYRREAEVAVSVLNALNDNHREHPLGDVIGSRVIGWLTMRY